MDLISAAILLFLVLDPLGNIPLFLSALGRVSPGRRPWVILRESVIAFGVLVFFFFFGRRMLDMLSLQETALGVAGGVILFLIALRMIFPERGNPYGETSGEPLIVPLAIPLISGPSAIATVLLFMARWPTKWPQTLLAITCAWAASTLILVSSSIFNRVLGERGLAAVERLMGMILATISIQMLMNGISEFLRNTTP